MTRASTFHAGYRPEVDGLRAVAVVPVVLFHAGLPGVDGGFVGVDVFFVISGFLITGILVGDIEAGRFSLVTFYERRVRRIFPALFAMLAICSLIALAVLLPFELDDFAESLRAAALFVSNFYFMAETGYFVAAAETKPLLHTWSLAIEEQFYIAFPLFLFVTHRFAGRLLLPVILVALTVSLIYCIAITHPQNDRAFFYTPARVWELLARALLAIVPSRSLRRAAAEVGSLVGLFLIAFAVFGFDARTPFPGWAALFPVVGTMLILVATSQHRTVVGQLLSWAPVRFVGLISYSLYLWHWPLLVFYRLARVAPPTGWETAFVVLGAFAAAVLSWRFVERPFRRRTLLARRWPLLGTGLAGMALAILLANGAIARNGLPGRVPQTAQGLAAVRFDEVDFSHCDSLPGGRPCLIGVGGIEDALFVVWGDSHAGMLMPAFQAAAATEGITGLYLGAAGCVPLLGVNQLRWGFQTCDEGAEAVLDAIAANPALSRVILVSRWAFYAHGTRFQSEVGHPVFIRDAETRQVSLAENRRVFARGVERTIGALHALGRQVAVVRQVPENEFDLAVAMARAQWLGRETAFAPSRQAYEERQALTDGIFDALDQVATLDLGSVLCQSMDCPVSNAGRPLYRDSNHLTATFARTLAPIVAPLLRDRNP